MQLWALLGMARLGREPRYLPSESYLGQGYDDNNDYDLPVHLPMGDIVTLTANCEKTSLVGDCTGSITTILKGQLRPICH